MTSLRLPMLLLAVAVALPTAALAWLGLGSTGALERQLRSRLDDDVQAAADALHGFSFEAHRVLTRSDLELAEALGAEVSRRLPEAAPRSLVSTVDDVVRALAPAQASALRSARIEGPRGALLPVPFDPDAMPTDATGLLLADLALAAERALARGAAAGAAPAVWTDARPALEQAHLGLAADVGAAWVRARGGGSAAAETRTLAPQDLALLASPAARTWLLLSLRAATLEEDGPSAERLQHAVERGDVDRVPLTRAERAAIHRVARRPGGPVLEPLAPEDVLVAPLPEGLRLVVERAPGSALVLRCQALLELWERSAHAERVALARGFGALVDGTARPCVAAFGALGTMAFTLTHKEEGSVGRELQSRRRWATLGVVGLAAVGALGLLLVRRAVAREREAVRLRDEFLANVSHELRTPLTAVCLHADLLAEERVSDERRRAHAEVVRAEGARLASLVDDLLDVAALERGAGRLDVGPVDLGAAVRAAAAPFAAQAEREGRVFAVTASEAGAALADPRALSRILANLLRNAFDHGRPARGGGPGRVEVEAACDARCCRVLVRDDGPGVPLVERERLFERFRRGSTAQGTRGTGLGLALSRALARAMGGDLVLSDDGRATEFRLTLPAAPHQEDAPG